MTVLSQTTPFAYPNIRVSRIQLGSLDCIQSLVFKMRCWQHSVALALLMSRATCMLRAQEEVVLQHAYNPLLQKLA